MKYAGEDVELIIFDLDGTLLDSSGIWDEVDRVFFASHGLPLPSHYGKEIAVMGLSKGAEYTRDTYFPTLSKEEILGEWDALAKKEYEESIPLKDGAIPFLDYCASLGIPLVVATSNSPSLYQPCLRRLGLEKYFQSYIDAEEVPSGKDSTKMYDTLVKRFGAHIENTLVIEDSLKPLCLAAKAGYLTLGVYDEKMTKDPKEHQKAANYFAFSLKEALMLLKKENNHD